MEQLIGAAPGGPSAANLIKDSDIAHFKADVLDASKEVPVIVDFWATWCGPCKQLGPVIEKAVRDAKGAVRLVKIDVDKNPEIAQQMRIQSIPAVYAFYKGQPVDGFVGAQPESQVKAFIKRLIQAAGGAGGPSPLEEALEAAAEAIKEGDSGTASAIYGQILAQEPGNVPATAGLARTYQMAGDLERAKALLAGLPKEAASHPEVGAVRAAIEMAEQAAAAGDLAPLEARLAANPADHEARFDLAVGLFAAGRQEAAIDALLELYRRDRKWNDEAARKQLVKIFEALGPMDPLTVAARKRLSSLMFA